MMSPPEDSPAMPPVPGAIEDAGLEGADAGEGQLRRLARRLEFDRAVF